MRFCLGKVPPNEEFHPERDGWRKVREPSFLAFYVLALPVAAATALGLTIAIASVGDTSAKIVIKPGDVTTVRFVFGVLLVTLGFLAILAVHECVHLVAHPRCGLSRDSVLGIWPSRGVAYAHYDAEISRNRFLFMIALPFLIMSIAPVVLFWATGQVNIWLAFVALINGIGSCFDILVIVICWVQLPRDAVLRNKGWDTYWRHDPR